MQCTSYTNDLESDNMNIKCTFNGKKAWENAVDLLQHRSMEIHENLKQAAYDEGNYRLCLALIHMEFSPVVWSNITKQEQSENLMKQRLLPQNRTQNWLSVSAEESELSKWFCMMHVCSSGVDLEPAPSRSWTSGVLCVSDLSAKCSISSIISD